MDKLTMEWLRAIDYDDFHEQRFNKIKNEKEGGQDDE